MTIPGLSLALATTPVFSPGVLVCAGLPEFAAILAALSPETADKSAGPGREGKAQPSTGLLLRLTQAPVEGEPQPDEGGQKEDEKPEQPALGAPVLHWPLLPPQQAPLILPPEFAEGGSAPTAACSSAEPVCPEVGGETGEQQTEPPPAPATAAEDPPANVESDPPEQGPIVVLKPHPEPQAALVGIPSTEDAPLAEPNAESAGLEPVAPERRTTASGTSSRIQPRTSEEEKPAAPARGGQPFELPHKAVVSGAQNQPPDGASRSYGVSREAEAPGVRADYGRAELAFVARLTAPPEKDGERFSMGVEAVPETPACPEGVHENASGEPEGRAANTPASAKPAEPPQELLPSWTGPARIPKPEPSSGDRTEALAPHGQKEAAALDGLQRGDAVPAVLRPFNVGHNFTGASLPEPVIPAKPDGNPDTLAARISLKDGVPPPAERPMPVREIAVRVSGEGQPGVEIRVRERAGELVLAVGTRDAELGRALGRELPELADRLGSRGFQGEVWRPGGVEHQPGQGGGSGRWGQEPSQRQYFAGEAPSWERRQGGEQQRREQRQRRKLEVSRVSFSLPGILGDKESA